MAGDEEEEDFVNDDIGAPWNDPTRADPSDPWNRLVPDPADDWDRETGEYNGED
jgi:hypothetical protein